ncbi:MAG: 2-oxo acid dehydrogenase subunit E2 [Sedimentisphaerales bacterium]|nr:2-oxo acid dehydrogenase subunit E2 [Sedimentisphaerales bacterium]
MEASASNKIRSSVIPLTYIQKLIIKRMLSSKQTKPCFYLEVKADITELMDNRHKLKKSTGVKITTNSFYIRVLALSALKYPLVLGTYNDGKIKIADSINVGFAVNAPHGLVVPVIKNAHQKSLVEIAKEEMLMINKSRANTLTLEDVSGETTALSNLGAYGIDSFIGIVPPPASVILSVGNTIHECFYDNGKISERKVVSLSVAADAAIVTGSYTAQFLAQIKTLLQNPNDLI